MPVKPARFTFSNKPAVKVDRRPSARERGYTSQWDKASKAFLREHPLCHYCQLIGLLKPAECVDHKQPHKGDYGMMWDADNWASACLYHNSTKRDTAYDVFVRGLLSSYAVAGRKGEGG